MRANRAPTAMCHRQRFLALAMFEPARPCSTCAGTKLEDKDAGKRRGWSCSTNTKPKPAVGARQSSMPSFRTCCRASRRLAGDQTEISSSRAAPQALQDRRLHRPDASWHTRTRSQRKLSNAGRAPAHSRDVVSFRRLDHVAKQR